MAAAAVTSEFLVPIVGCWVCRRGTKEPLGLVHERSYEEGNRKIKVHWGNASDEWLDVSEVRCGIQVGWVVQDIPLSTTRHPLGPGLVVAKRTLAQREQLLVQLEQDGRSVWLPYENLRRIKDARMRYVRAETGISDHAERFRLRLLAHALENWNQLTGSLDRLDVDPLPHQIQLVHRILSSGSYNWLIADDVGLGKTIEVGLLLAALKRRGQARRVLVVAPAGLTRQWQDELRYKFDQAYEIYGRDFEVNQSEHWKLHDHVITSIDLAKREEHLAKFLQAGGWDVVVFDEGHKLTRYGDGERAQRYRLAEALRPESDAFLLLSGTPHQGYTDRFIALLELVRPDLRRQIHAIEANPEIVGEMILRNRKSEVTDADGTLIFKGQQIHRVALKPSRETQHFHAHLHSYLSRGYKAGEKGGSAGRAIGFVMTTFRKLASSSIAAIERALQLRLERLAVVDDPLTTSFNSGPPSVADLSEGGDDQDDLAAEVSSIPPKEFFVSETPLLRDLLASAAVVRRRDEKLLTFLDEVVTPLVKEGEKLLVFTEYRATQSYLEQALRERFPTGGEVVLINGSMKLDEKLRSIDQFNDSAQFMISTEAGGEGINLQQNCHVMVNFDLPWNPARLVQRIGRLYRYGQQKRVVVFNLHAQDSFDNKAIDLMLDRVMHIARDMAPIGPEYNDRLYSDILGELLEHLDLAAVLQASSAMQIERTQEQIEQAIVQAERAKRLQDELFTYVGGYDPATLQGTLGFTMSHVGIFIRGMLTTMGVEITAESQNSRVLEIRLPENLRGAFSEFGHRSVVRITTDRRLAQHLKDVMLLDFEAPFFKHLIEAAKAQSFDGIYASALLPVGVRGALAAFKLRWQNDQGDALMEELVTVFASAEGGIERNPAFLTEWLGSPMHSAPAPPANQARSDVYDRLESEANRLLAVESTRFKHPNSLVRLAAADGFPV